jgi:hypothetical protein
MWIVRAVLDRIVLLSGVVIAGCVPGFIAQYRQRLNGALDQALHDLAPFQMIADQEHHGSLNELIQYHMQSLDPTFHREGTAIQAMVDSADRLRLMVTGLNTDLAHQFIFLVANRDNSLLRATWGDYRPAFALDLQGVLFAIVIGLSLWALFMLLWFLCAWLFGSIAGNPATRTASRLR